MIIIENNVLPFKGFKAMNLFGVFLFVRNGAKMDSEDMNHEEIHSVQWRELLYVGFLLWYCFEYIANLFRYQSFKEAYRNISFELEAYDNQDDLMYLYNRKKFAFMDYL